MGMHGSAYNEIKNYWNTRIKRHQRACLPLYPPEVCMQTLCKSQHGQSTDGVDGDDGVQHDFLQQNSRGVHEAIFSSLEDNQGMLPYMPGLPEISSCNMLLKGLGSSQHCNFVPSTFPNHKHLQEPTMPYLGSSGMGRNDWFHPFDHIGDNTSVKIAQSFGMHSPLDPGPSSHSTICYSHSLSNGNASTSKPTSEAVKLELPSFQYPEIDLGSWDTYSPPPLLESIDDFIQSPPPICVLESDYSSPHNSGLLDAMLYQAKTLSSSKNHYSEKSSISSTATPGDKADSSTLNLYETEWEDYADNLSPFGATSILNECPPVNANGNSLDKQPPVPSLSGNMVKSESVDQIWTPKSKNKTMSVLNITQPDILLASDWHEHGYGHDKNQTIANLGNDLATDQHGTSGTSKSSQVWGVGSCAWNKYARGLSSI